MTFKQIYISVFLILFGIIAKAEPFQIQSPDGKIQINVIANEKLEWSVKYDNQVVLLPSKIDLIIRDQSFEFTNVETKYASVDEKIKTVYGKVDELQNKYNAVTIQSKQHVSIEFRAYNNGVAYRFQTQFNEPIIVKNEVVEWNINNYEFCWWAPEQTYQQPFEGEYVKIKIADLTNKSMAITPILYQKEMMPSLLITDANMESYPGMFLIKTTNGFEADFAEKAKKQSLQFAGKISPIKMPYFTKMMVREREEFIAKTAGSRTFPWRVMLIEKNELNLMNNNIVQCLADDSRIEETSWIKPGKVAWDWYHSWDIPFVDFKTGVNEETYKYYIDFAAENNFEYINIDFSWSPLLKLDKPKRKVNLPEVIQYAKTKGVGVFIWVVWQELNSDMDRYLDIFESWGISGLKVDFMDRDDQDVVDFYYELADKAAARKLLVNYHGAYKADGISMVYPNVINREGVCGLEQNKFSKIATPHHNLILPFTRNAVGMMDYTPGAMRYTTPAEYKKNWKKPTAMTTQAHQLAMYVVYYGPLQMIADAPTLYPENVLKFLKKVPTTWDKTVPLAGKTGEFAIVARKNGNEWYIGAMNGTNQNLSKLIQLNFLDTKKNYRFESWVDGERIDKSNYSSTQIKGGAAVNIDMKATGGAVYCISEM